MEGEHMDQAVEATKPEARKPETVALGGPLEGKSVVIDLDRLTIRKLAEFQSGQFERIAIALGNVIIGGDLGEDVTETILDTLHYDDLMALSRAILATIEPKKGL